MSDATLYETDDSCDVAIIGMAGRFPGSPDVAALWRTVSERQERISFFSDDELEISLSPEDLANPYFVKAKGVLDDVEMFDAAFFNISARMAEWMDPQQRVFLECVWAAIEDAGYDVSTYQGLIAVYAGASANTYMLSRLPRLSEPGTALDTFQLIVLNDKDHLATRAAYKLNLRGEAVTLQTTCSTSLVAVHFACQSLLSGQCDMALAGGVSIQVPQRSGYLYREGMVASPDGHCRAFDARARGTVSGNGVGVVVLKRLSDALAEGDCVHAIIKGSAINNDGNDKVGYTAPCVDGQAAVIARALAMAGVSAETVQYVEAHGTGTPVGDPIEVEALTKTYRQHTGRKQFCALGSIKTNIGHLDAAAGVAGLIKATMALKHKQIPPTVHFEQPNPSIDFENSPFYVNRELLEWPRGATPRRAGVSSFGIGGTNAHVILEESPINADSSPSRTWQLITLSAKSITALESKAEALATCFDNEPEFNFADAAYTCNAGRQQFSHHRYVVARTFAEAAAALRVQTATPRRATERAARVGFMFPGQGAQSVGMARALYEREREFRIRFDECASALERVGGPDVRAAIYTETDAVGSEIAATKLSQPSLTLPALFTIEYALAHLWMSWGVRPAAMIGHSFGEYVAACLAGVFSVEEALMVSAARGSLMQRMVPGRMVAVRLDEARASTFLRDGLELAAVNSREGCVITGSIESAEALKAELSARGIIHTQLEVPFAYHSVMVEPILAEFTEVLLSIELRPPSQPFISCLTGDWIRDDQATDPLYWAEQMRRPVRFATGLDNLLKSKVEVIIEIGPGKTLSAPARQQVGLDGEAKVIATFGHSAPHEDEQAQALRALGSAWEAGATVDWKKFYSGERRRRVQLPTYPFERQRYWIEAPEARHAAFIETAQGGTDEQGNVPASSRHEVERGHLPAAYEGPRNEMESAVAEVWGEVLGLEGVGIHDNFYDLGGDSLLATQVYSRLTQRLTSDVTLQQVLMHQTVAGLAESISANGQPSTSLTIDRVPRGGALPTSFAQQRMWFVCQSAPNSSVYNLGNAVRMSGRLVVTALERCLREVVRRHEVLRTRFEIVAGRPMQVVEDSFVPNLPLIDLSGLKESAREMEVAALASAAARRPFDLSVCPLMRAQLIRLSDEEHVALFSMHHIISDAWSFSVLVREIAALYEAFATGRPSSLSELPIQYADFAYWQRQRLQGTVLQEQLDYWRRQLGGHLPVLELPADRPRPSTQSFRGANVRFEISPELTRSLEGFAREEGTTLYTLLLAVFNTLLHRYTKQDEIVIGSPVAGRQVLETEGLIGMFINTIALRTSCAGDPTFRSFLRASHETARGAFHHQELPFEKLVEVLQPERAPDRNPVFQVFFNFQNTPPPVLEIGGLTLEGLEYDSRSVALDLILNVIRDGERLRCVAQYCTDLFDSERVNRMLIHFERLLADVVARPDAELSSLEYRSEEEVQHQLVVEQEREESLRFSLKQARRRPVGSTL